ncbi:MAG: hypothetical protein ACK4G3_00680 [bacterium]
MSPEEVEKYLKGEKIVYFYRVSPKKKPEEIKKWRVARIRQIEGEYWVDLVEDFDLVLG